MACKSKYHAADTQSPRGLVLKSNAQSSYSLHFLLDVQIRDLRFRQLAIAGEPVKTSFSDEGLPDKKTQEAPPAGSDRKGDPGVFQGSKGAPATSLGKVQPRERPKTRGRQGSREMPRT
eukprot:746022-Hanusia_phi.AAC.1